MQSFFFGQPLCNNKIKAYFLHFDRPSWHGAELAVGTWIHKTSTCATKAGCFFQCRNVQTSLHSKVEIMKWMGQRQVTSVLAGNPPGPESSLHKLLWSEYHTWFTAKTMHILGADAMTPNGREAAHGIQTDAIGAEFSSLAWVQTMLGARPGTIYAGTSEVQRNIVGDRVLGLPREPRADSGPWNEIGKS